MRKLFWRLGLPALAACFALQPVYGAVTVLTVPWVASNPLSPHTTYPATGTTESMIVMGATVPSAVGSSDSFSVTWAFGDGSPNVTFALTNPYDISTTHQYPASATNGTAWTATVTVTDNATLDTGSANFYVIQSQNNLPARVNVAIDWGLWYMHQTMWRDSITVGSNTVARGGWDTAAHPCNNVNAQAWDCTFPGVINAENVQAFEVSGHVGSGPAADPYTEDVQRGLARMFQSLGIQSNNSQKYVYDPVAANYACSTATTGVNSNPTNTSNTTLGSLTYPYCPAGSSQVFYNSNVSSCSSPPCSFTFDGNSNGQMIFSNDGSGETIYTTGPFIDALVASGTPNATAPTGVGPSGALPGVLGQSYKSIVQDMLDWYASCQWEDDYDLGNPNAGHGVYVRGGGYSGSGGGWLYNCQQGDDNSTSQWAAIGFIGGLRGFAIPVPQVVTDFNNVWVTNSQTNNYAGRNPTGPDPYAAGDDNGSAGYRGDIFNSNAWTAFATSPSNMVQMTLDGIGRSNNTAFGSSNDADQRFNNAETFYADNFCNAPSGGAANAPRAYTYGLFSFTKTMLLHSPGGALSPIQFMRTQTPGVFTSNVSAPPNSIDWYAALSPSNGGTDPCDGVAQTLVSYQLSPPGGWGTFDGHWAGHDYDEGYQAAQSPFETAWSIIMLQKTVFVSCVNNLTGRGSASGPFSALAWSAQTNATGYAVLRSSTNGGPYSQVGTTNLTNFRDTSPGLVAGGTYYYVVQPLQGTTEVCQSNQARVIIP